MLLIQADLIKSVWFTIFPIVTYTRGHVASDSAFCQVSGFFFAVGIESSDVAVLLIAVHSAMYIFRPKSGLYPYRWLAYATYVVVPLLLASLAFLDGGYENVGYFCYVSNETGWARLALSWVPRHILFAIIILTYSCIYVYVRHRILDYERRDSVAPHKQLDERRHTRLSVSAYRDRIRSLPSALAPSVGRFKGRVRSVSVGNAASPTWTRDSVATGPIAWNIPRFSEQPSLELERLTTDEQDPHSTSTVPYPSYPAPTAHPSRRASAHASSSFSITSAESWKLAKVSEEEGTIDCLLHGLPTRSSNTCSQRLSSCATIPAMFPLWQGITGVVPHPRPPSPTSSARTAATTTIAPNSLLPEGEEDGGELTPHISHDPLTSQVSRNRDKIRRQLRALFVYPLLYLVIWIFPLVNQAYGYTRNQPVNRPGWVLMCSLASLAIQGAADSAVFTAKEKPWQHVGGEGFWGSMRRGWWWRRGDKGAGRTREEMLVEVRIARARRRQEMRDEMGGGEKKRGEGEKKRGEGERRHWWDLEEHGDV
jgi:G protein-coupled receptor GPR1